MKTAKYLFVAMGLVLVLFSCSFDSSGLNANRSDTFILPADKISDISRSFSGSFDYETLLPVSLQLKIDLYETVPSADGLSLQQLSPDAARAVIVLKDLKGNTVYEGGMQADGTLKAQLALPAAPEDMVLTIKAPGYEQRSVTISNPVQYSEINRTMGLMSEGVAAKGQVLVDSDGDLVPDVYDAYPLDPDVAFTVRIPDEESLTVAFEDLYLRERAGDADYNDFLAQYTITEYYKYDEVTGKNLLKKIEGEATAKVKIAGFNHGFGISIGYEKESGDDLEVTIEHTYYDEYGIRHDRVPRKPVENITRPFNSTYKNKAVIPLFKSTKDAIGKTASFVVGFSEAVDRDKVELAPYDPYLYVRDTGYDIHLVGKDPLPNTHNPWYSYINVSMNFRDDEGFPWALLVPADWQHPAECQFIEVLYPFFEDWREDYGASNSNWYLRPLDPKNKAPYPVTSDDPKPEYPAYEAESLYYQLEIEMVGKLKDPDGDEVVFRSSELPEYMKLDEDSGLVTITNALPGQVTAYFWSEDTWGADSSADAFKAIFTFVEQAERMRLIVETYPYDYGVAATDTTLELYDSSGLLDSDENNPGVPPLHSPSAMIVYLPSEDLESGTVLFVKIYSAAGNRGPYSIRVFDLAENAVLPDDLPEYKYSGRTGINSDDTPYEEREAGLESDPWKYTYEPGEGPAVISFGPENPLHRYLATSSDVDWIMFTVP
jgi:LruC domain-containing protein